MSDVVVLTGNLLCSSAMRASRPHTSSGPHPSEHPPTRPSRRHALPARPSTSSGIPDQQPVLPIVVTSPFAGVSPVPVRFYYVIRRTANLIGLQALCRFYAHPPKKRQIGRAHV